MTLTKHVIKYCICFLIIVVSKEARTQISDARLDAYIRTYQSRNALQWATKQLQTNSSDKSKAMYYHTRLGFLHSEFGDFTLAEQHARKAVGMLPLVNDSLLWAEANMVMAQCFLMKRQIDSLKYYIDLVIPFADRVANANLVRMYHSHLGNYCLLTNNQADALKYYEKALAITEKEDLSRFEAKSLFSVAVATSLTDPDKGLFIMKQSLSVSEKNHDSTMIANCYSGLAMNYLARQDIGNWQKFNTIAIRRALEAGLDPLAVYSYMQELDYLISQKLYVQAYNKGKEVGKESRLLKTTIFEMYLDSMMYITCKELKKDREALQYLERFLRAKNNMFKTKQTELKDNLSLEYELKEKNLQIYNQNLVLTNQRNRNILLLGANLLFVLVLSFIFFFKKVKSGYIRKLYKKDKMMDQLLEQERKLTKPLDKEQVGYQVQMEEEGTMADVLSEFGVEQSQMLFRQMIQILESEKLYLNPELSQKTLVTLLGTNRNYLSKAISENSEENFKQIINRYRVEEVKKRIKQMVIHQTGVSLEQLYPDAGFNSESSYYRAFRYFTGLTPKEYMVEFAKDVRQRKGVGVNVDIISLEAREEGQ